MNIEIKLVGELNELQPVLNVLTGAGTKAAAAPARTAPAAANKVKAETAEDAGEEETEKPVKAAGPAKKAAPAPAAKQAAGPAKKAAKPAPAEEEVDFSEMEEEDQLAEIVKVATRFTKKGKTADIKQLLNLFDAQKATSLDPATYGEFYGLLTRYADGEAVEDLVAEYEI